jgi:hypothetical protein
MKMLLLWVGALLLAVPVQAQTAAVGTENLTWDQAASNLAEAQSLGYDVQDGAAPAAPLAGVACSGSTSPFTCQARLPALTTGLHSLALRARATVNGTVLSSAFSAPLSLLIVAVPAIPQNVRLGSAP